MPETGCSPSWHDFAPKVKIGARADVVRTRHFEAKRVLSLASFV